MDVMPLAPGMCSGPTSAPPSSMRRRSSLNAVTTVAPMTAPLTLASPPTTIIASTAKVCAKKNWRGPKAMLYCAQSPPPAPISADESTHAPSRSRTTSTPRAEAASRSSRLERSVRPGRLSRNRRANPMLRIASPSAHQMVVWSGTPNRPVEPRVMLSHDSKTTNAITSRPIVAMAIAFSSMRVSAMPTTNAMRPATAAASRIAGTKPSSASITKPGRSGSAERFTAGGMVASAATYAPTPMKAMWPNVTMPELPENVWIDSTSTSEIRKFTTTRWSAGANDALAISDSTSSGMPKITTLRRLRRSATRLM